MAAGYSYLFKCTWYNEVRDCSENVHHIILADNFTDAVEQVENYYKNELESFEVTCIDDSLPAITEECYNVLLNGGF